METGWAILTEAIEQSSRNEKTCLIEATGAQDFFQ